MAKARYKDADVDLIREANAHDPGFDAKMRSPMLVRNAKGEKQVVPGNELLVYAAQDEPAPAGRAGKPN